MSLPTIRPAHDDDFASFVGPAGTTLVLCTDNFELSISDANIQSPKLMVYADAVTIPDSLESKGKNLSIHCNTLKYPIDADHKTVINVAGAAGDKLPSQDSPKDNPTVNGKDGGKIVVHVHNLKLHPDKDLMKFELFNMDFKFDGGTAGSTNIGNGTSGKNGNVEIYYSNPLLRAITSLQDEYRQATSAPERLGVLRTHCIPILDQQIRDTMRPWPEPADNSWLKTCTDGWINGLKDVLDKTDHWFKVHTVFIQCADLLKIVHLPEAAMHGKETVQAFLADMNKLLDLSIISEDDCGKFNSLLDALRSFSILKIDSSPKEKQIGMEWITSEFITINDCVANVRNSFKDKGDLSQIATPLKNTIYQLWSAFSDMLTKAGDDMRENCFHSDKDSSLTWVSSWKAADDSLATDVPLVHPDQCLMALSRADAAFFSEDFVDARARYLTIRERLSFVPRISQNKNLEHKDLPEERWPLYNALARMQNEERLAIWMFNTLDVIYRQVIRRLNQLSMGMDMFNLEKNWAPRLSFKFYLDFAGQQLQRLKQFEISYWQIFEALQAQAQATSSLHDTQAINLYRIKDAEDRIKSAVATIKRLESEITAEDTDFQTKRKKFKEELEKVESALKDYRYHNPARIVGTVATFLVGIGALFLGPVGWVGAAACFGSGIAQSVGMYEDAKNQIEDTYGVVVNKNYVITDINTSEGDLNNLLTASAYTTEANGTMTVNAETNAKIIATEEQVEKFLKQFKDKFPENKGLSDALDAFTTVSKLRNAKIAAYNNAVIDLYQQILQRNTLENQGRDISQELIKQNQGLPSIVGYYRRVRDEIRLAILRTVKHSALALSYWGLHDLAKFSAPSLLSTVDELASHLGVMLAEYEYCLAYFGDYSQVKWPARSTGRGIRYKLAENELLALKTSVPDPFNLVDNVNVKWNSLKNKGAAVLSGSAVAQEFATVITGLKSPVRRGTSLLDSPFAGHANVRISQVNFWAPGLQYLGDATRLTRLVAEVRHEGVEMIVDAENKAHSFKHLPVFILSESNPSVKLDDMAGEVNARQAMASDWSENNINALTQAPLGPFADWRVVVREKDQGGPLDWSAVKEAYLEFEGCGMPFKR